MIYGRVIGNDLRDVPPEYLPVWGQRWSSYRTAHGPSPFSTRVFSANGMCEVGPVLTSPTQFETLLADEDDGENASELISWSDTPTPQSSHCLSNRPPEDPSTTHQSTPPQTLFPGQSSARGHDPELSPARKYGTIQGNYGFHENDLDLWIMDRTLTSTQHQVGPSHVDFSGQLQSTIPPHSVPEWQFAHQSVYPFQSNLWSNFDNSHLPDAFPNDNRSKFTSAMSSPSFHCFRMPMAEQSFGMDSLAWGYESDTGWTSGSTYPRSPMISQCPEESASPDPFPPGSSNNAESALAPTGIFRQAISGDNSSSHSGTTCLHDGGCTSTPPGK